MEKRDIDKIREWAEEYCADHGLFLVDIVVNAKNITVSADSMTNITIEECAKLARFLIARLEEESDILNLYTFDVSSPGMSNGFKLPIQYQKRLGKSMNVVAKDSLDFEGFIKDVNEDRVEFEQIIPANKKTKEEEKRIIHTLTYNQIIKATIPFKFKK